MFALKSGTGRLSAPYPILREKRGKEGLLGGLLISWPVKMESNTNLSSDIKLHTETGVEKESMPISAVDRILQLIRRNED